MIAYLDEHKDAKKTAHWVEKAGRRAVLMAGDVAEQTHCRALVERALREFGRLDILVNNAAMQRTHKELSEITAEEWDRTFRTNIYSQFYLCQAAVPRMKPGSTIVNTTSINAKTPSPQLLAYAATKGAIANFTVCLAQMLERARDCRWSHGRLLYEAPTEAAERLPEIISPLEKLDPA